MEQTKGYSTYADLAGIASGTYTYQATGVNGAAATVLEVELSISVVIDFAAKTILQTVSGTVALGQIQAEHFLDISKAHYYTSSSSNLNCK